MSLRIENAVDLHCHFAPDTIGGSLDYGDPFHAIPAVDTAREALANGYAAIVLKPHSFANPGLAQSIERGVPGLRIFGGICTDHATGGLNVYAVEAALSMGTKIVWLPTIHSSVDFGIYPMGERRKALGPIRVMDDDGSLVPAVHEIFDLVKSKDAVLATGHISAEEHHAVVKEFGKSGKILVTHAGERGGARLTPEESAELADLGAAIEITALNCQEVLGEPGKSPEEMVEYIRTVGPSRCMLSTDYGWAGSTIPRPVSGFLEFLEVLWKIGLPEDDLTLMASTNPARLLELPFA